MIHDLRASYLSFQIGRYNITTQYRFVQGYSTSFYNVQEDTTDNYIKLSFCPAKEMETVS